MIAKTHSSSIRLRDPYGPTATEEKPAIGALHNELTFYPAFLKDLTAAKREVIIYSPFVSKYRTNMLKSAIERLIKHNVDVFIFTRLPEEYDWNQREQARGIISRLEETGAYVFALHGGIHEKVAIIDREILWEGSLNILSQRSSREMMRRTFDANSAEQVMGYLRLNGRLAEGYKRKYERLYRSLMADSKRGVRVSRRFVVFGAVAVAAAWWIMYGRSGMIALNGLQDVIAAIRLYTGN